MKTKWVIDVVLIATASFSSYSQGFVNLNCESANIPTGTTLGTFIPISKALPGWSGGYLSSNGIIQGNQIVYNGFSFGGAAISIVDSNAGFDVEPINGKYGAILFGGGDNPLFGGTDGVEYSAMISQTGLVPVGAESLQIQISTVGGVLTPFIVSLGGQTISMFPLATFPGYTEYGGDVSAFAGEIEQLSITEPPPGGAPPSVLELDNIVFSPSPVPEPATCALILAGIAFLGLKKASQRP